MTPREHVRALLADLADVPVADDAPLVLDSLALVQLVESLEDALEIRIAAKDVTPANFGSVAAIVAFLESKR